MSQPAASVGPVLRGMPSAQADRETDARAWLSALRGSGPEREQAAAELHALLLRAAHFELQRRRAFVESAARESVEDLAVQSANDALSAILTKLDDYRF